MKQYRFFYQDYHKRMIEHPIRNRYDFINLVVASLEIILLQDDSLGKDYSFEIYINKMSRLFFVTENKVFSIVFPFSIDVKGDEINVEERNVGQIQTYHVVGIRSILNYIHFDQMSLSELFDAVLSDENSIEFSESELEECWHLFSILLSCEAGYIRYDHDEIRENGIIHPLDHFDINYTSNAAFKLGTHERINSDFLRKLLDVNEDCMFIA